MKCVLSDIDVPGAVVPDTTDMTIPIAVCAIVVGVLLLIAVVGLVGVIKRKQLGQLCVVVKRKQTSKQVAVRGMCVLSVYTNSSFCGGVNIHVFTLLS